jgi:Ser/Thr protein kinase RdoA (MazF antagonist)
LFSLGTLLSYQKLATKGDRVAYKVVTTQATAVIKASARTERRDKIERDVFCLKHLDRNRVPAPELFSTASGDSVVTLDGRLVYVYRFIEGTSPRPDESCLAALGVLLARLHMLSVEGYPYASTFTPDAVLPFVREHLPEVVCEGQEADVAFLLREIEVFPSFDGLPRSIIHSDPYFSNIVQDDDQLSFIDLDDAGVAPAIIDVGYVLAHCCTTHPGDRAKLDIAGDGIMWHPEWAKSFLDAYQAVRALTADEKAHLADAARFAMLAYIADWESQKSYLEIGLERYRLLREHVPRLVSCVGG